MDYTSLNDVWPDIMAAADDMEISFKRDAVGDRTIRLFYRFEGYNFNNYLPYDGTAEGAAMALYKWLEDVGIHVHAKSAEHSQSIELLSEMMPALVR